MRPFVSLLALLAVAASASAQPTWRPALDGPAVSLDVLKLLGQRELVVTDDQGNVVGEGGPGLLETAQILSARIPIGPTFAVVADLPMAYASYSVSDGLDAELEHSEFGIGNPYLGAEAALRDDATVEAGVRLPLGSEAVNGPGQTARYTGSVALFEAPETYWSNTLTATLGGRYEPALSPRLRLRLRAVPGATWYSYALRGPRGEGDEVRVEDSYLQLQYGAQLVGLAGPAELVGGVVGQAHTSGGFDNPPVALGVGASTRTLPVRLGASARVPVLGGAVGDLVVGLSLDVPFR